MRIGSHGGGGGGGEGTIGGPGEGPPWSGTMPEHCQRHLSVLG